MSLPDLKPKCPIKERGVSWQRTETAKTLLSLINSHVRLFLLILTAMVSDSDVI